MKTMKSLYKILIFGTLVIMSLNVSAGGGVTQNISALSLPIQVGNQVYFNSTVAPASGCSDVLFEIDFGPFAFPRFANVSYPEVNQPLFSVIGPIVFNAPGMMNVNQTGYGECSFQPPSAITAINILPAPAIPTLTEWGLIVVGFFLVIFGVITLKSKHQSIIENY